MPMGARSGSAATAGSTDQPLAAGESASEPLAVAESTREPATATDSTREPLATRIAHSAVSLAFTDLPHEVTDKVKLCLFDLIGCAFEARDLPWSRQAVRLAGRIAGDATTGAAVIGSPHAASHADAAFANAVMGHALVREDMHSGSISHLGVVVLPTLLALAQYRRVTGRDFIAATAVGYEVGAQIGRAVMDADLARRWRPTGITGPVGAAAAGARLLGFTVEETTSALALGANTVSGFNEWAHTGGSEMFFHVGFAARNAVTAVRLAEFGAFASPSALDGTAGLFVALGRPFAGSAVRMFRGAPELLSVYHKPVPACNFAQTACQAALRLALDAHCPVERIASIAVRVPRAAAAYPGCDFAGPFAHVLQAKMSIQYNVAAALIKGSVSERNFALLDDPDLQRLVGMTRIEVDDAMTAAYPDRQGGEVDVGLTDGTSRRIRLDDVVNASDADVRRRFLAAAEAIVGDRTARDIETFIDGLEQNDDVGQLGTMLRGPVPHTSA